jgi:hypothetical protein
LISYENKKNLTKTIKNKIKSWKKKKKEKSYLNVVASEAKERNFFFVKHINFKKTKRIKEEEDIPEHGGKEKEMRREKKRKK